VIQDGKIVAIGDAADVKTPDRAKVVNLSGYSVIPGLVGMHNHLHYTADQSQDAPGPLINSIQIQSRTALSARASAPSVTRAVYSRAPLNLRN